VVGVVALLGVLSWGCDPGWFLYARNNSAETVLVRLASLAFTDVYEVPPGFEGRLYAEIGTFEGGVELLNPQCDLLDDARLPEAGAVLVTIHPELVVTVESIGFDDIDGPSAVEIEGRCGSTSAP
jgi:hypothetical protein